MMNLLPYSIYVYVHNKTILILDISQNLINIFFHQNNVYVKSNNYFEEFFNHNNVYVRCSNIIVIAIAHRFIFLYISSTG